ncbi:MAG TPA: DUF72 domain-containing protein [Candidatus Dormibacteraeota bacterium]|nr:DUF72 domain-containing protein [Candidatus Dormibacteraeota bacterium]
MPERPKVESPRQQNLFELENPSEPASRRFFLPGIFLGTSSFTASGWEGSFYPLGMRSKDFLRHYASQFQTVEIDSTFYGTPSASTVTSWNEKTPRDFIFAAKVPQVITHEKVLVDYEPEFDEFIERMHLLGGKLGPMLLQFPKFDKWVLKSPDQFRARLQSFFKRAADLRAGRFAVEVRNKDWLDARLTDLLREHNVALALTDTSFMPRPWEMKGALDLITADFAYVRWLGNRKGIEEQTTTWDKTVIDRQADLRSWVVVLRRLVEDKLIRKIFAFANNHYAGHAPATVEQFWKLWKDR